MPNATQKPLSNTLHIILHTHRYQAIHDPINYRMKRTTKRVLFTIVFVWVSGEEERPAMVFL